MSSALVGGRGRGHDSSREMIENPLKRFPSKSRRMAPYFRSLDAPTNYTAEIEKRERWLQLDRLDPNFGISVPASTTSAGESGTTATTQEVFLRRSYRRLESSSLFFPPRMGASLAELSAPPAPENRRFILVQESRLRELAQFEAILREEREALGEQCSWILSDYRIDARIPVPATRAAVSNLCDADMRRLAGEMVLLHRTWRAYYLQQHYDRDEARTALPWNSYLGGRDNKTPLAQRPAKLVLLLQGQDARQLKRERDTMLFEDDLSFLVTAHQRAAGRKKDYERYFVLATRYGHMTEAEFSRDERPGRRYWVRALDGCLKFQRVWGAYWAVQSLRRYKGAKQFQKIVRGYLAYKKFHLLIIFRLKYGKSSYLKYSLRLWRQYIHIIKMCRESIAFFMENWVAKCLEAWKTFSDASKAEKMRIATQNRQRAMNAGLVKTFNALASSAKRQKYVKMKARRLLGMPHFDMWCEYVAISKFLKRQFKSATTCQSLARRFLARRIYAAKRLVGVKLGLVMRCRHVVDQRRCAEVRITYAEWKEATQESRSMMLSNAERARLETMQLAAVESEKKGRKDLKRHLKSFHGRAQLELAPKESLLQARDSAREAAELDLLQRCAELHRKMGLRDFNIRFPPAFRCVDPACCTTFTSEEQYHSHFRLAENHKRFRIASQSPHGPADTGSPGDGEKGGGRGGVRLASRKRLTPDEVAQMKLQDREKALAARLLQQQQDFDRELPGARAAAAEASSRLSSHEDEMAEKERAYKEYKAQYVQEVKSTKVLVQGLEISTRATRRQEISVLNKGISEKGRDYASLKTAHVAEVAAMVRQLPRLQADVAKQQEELTALEAAFAEDQRAHAEDMAAVAVDRAALEAEMAAAAAALRAKKLKEESDFKATLSLSSLHCLLLHPREFLILRAFLTHLLPPNAELRPPQEDEMSEEQLQQQQREVDERRRAEEAQQGGPVIRVKGWVFVRGKGWVTTKKPSAPKALIPKDFKGRGAHLQMTPGRPGRGPSSPQRGPTQGFPHVTVAPPSPSPALAATEPARDNALPEVHLLNCLDLWAAIQRWKTSALTTDAAYVSGALAIYETYLRPEGADEPPKGVRAKARQSLRALLRVAAGRLLGSPVAPEPEDGSSDESGSDDDDYESDSSDDEAVKEGKRAARERRRAKLELESRPVVRRTVDMRALDKDWPLEAIGSMTARLEAVRLAAKVAKKPLKITTSLYIPTQRPLSCLRKAFGMQPGSYSRWTDELTLPPDIFDALHWALFQYLYEKVHRESGFEKSVDFVEYRVLCVQEEAHRERLLFLDAKAARLDKFRRWAREEFVAVHRAQYKLALSCSDAVLERCADSLLALALKVCVSDRVWQLSSAAQAQHETTACVADEVAHWTGMRLADEWFDSFVDPYVRTLIGLPEVRIKLMVFCGMREAAVVQQRRAFDINSMKTNNLLDSFLSGEGDVETKTGEGLGDDGGQRVEGESSAEGKEGAEVGSAKKLPSPKDKSGKSATQTAAKKDTPPKLSGAALALAQMRELGMGTEADEAADKKNRPKRLDKAEAATRIQRRARGAQGRKRARAVFVRVFVKRMDARTGVTYYCDMRSNSSTWKPPSIYRTLFPWKKEAW